VHGISPQNKAWIVELAVVGWWVSPEALGNRPFSTTMSTLLADLRKAPTPKLSSHRVEELDGLRAVAIALVIGHHYPAFAGVLNGPQFGWAGVNVFFVLSGYLITSILIDLKGRRGAYQTFFTRRVRRIFPPYFVVVGVCVALAWFSTRRFDFEMLLLQTTFFRSFVGTCHLLHGLKESIAGSAPVLFGHSHLPGTGVLHPTFLSIALSPTWSVSVEEWFYILWAPVVLTFRRPVVAGIIALSLISTFLFRWLGQLDVLSLYENFFCQIDMLAIGAALALWLPNRNGSTRILVGSGAAATLSLLALLLWLHPSPQNEARGLLSFAVFGLPLISIAAASLIGWLVLHSSEHKAVCRALRLPFAVWIGRRSYTLYLIHLPIYFVINAMLSSTGIPHLAWISASLSLGLSLIAAALSWQIIEAPLLGNG
jgi:peptidoglycan/LPS O-acetylase OafA/YrhL